jgi:hypothetical protein
MSQPTAGIWHQCASISRRRLYLFRGCAARYFADAPLATAFVAL